MIKKTGRKVLAGIATAFMMVAALSVTAFAGKESTLNVSNLAKGNITEATSFGAFTVYPSKEGNIVSIDANGKSANGMSFTQRLKLGGAGTADARCVHFTTDAAANVYVYCMSSSSSEERALGLYSIDGTEIGTYAAPKSSLSTDYLRVSKAGEYYLASTAGGVNIYYISVVEDDVTPGEDPNTPVNPSPNPSPTPGNPSPVVPVQPQPGPGQYIGNINTELLDLTLNKNDVGYYISGSIVVVEYRQNEEGIWESNVPALTPTMKFVDGEGGEIEVFVTPDGSNAFYFDRYIGQLAAGKEYMFEISLTDPNNVSINKVQYVNTNTSPVKEKRMGLVDGQKIGYCTVTEAGPLQGALILKSYDGVQYDSWVNSNLENVACQKSEYGNFVSGQILVVEWLKVGEPDARESTVPWKAPKLTLVEKGAAEGIECYVAALGTNEFYFDRNMSDEFDTTKEYLFKLESADTDNVSVGNWHYVTTNYMPEKEGFLWETDTQTIYYKTIEYEGDNRLAVYAVNK